MIVTTTYLQQLAPSELLPAAAPRRPATVTRVQEVAPEFARFLYATIGREWEWVTRLSWSLERWSAWLSRPGRETLVSWLGGAPIGFCQLVPEPSSSRRTQVQIVYLGLIRRYFGLGLGGQLLTEGARMGWTLSERWPSLPPVSRLWLHTCSLDAPQALPNYRARGFRDYDRTVESRPHPRPPAGLVSGPTTPQADV